jgi:hypothetical protein
LPDDGTVELAKIRILITPVTYSGKKIVHLDISRTGHRRALLNVSARYMKEKKLLNTENSYNGSHGVNS